MKTACKLGWVMCGSFCTFAAVTGQMQALVDAGADVTPILSFAAASVDTRFGAAADWVEKVTAITGRPPLLTLPDVEPIGPKDMFDLLIVAPCTGTTLGGLANGISNTPATLAVKSHLRREKPVLIAVSTNDALGASFRNIAWLKNVKHLFFVPMRQDNVREKPDSLVADFTQIPAAAEAALAGIQIQPLLI